MLEKKSEKNVYERNVFHHILEASVYKIRADR